MTDPKRVELRVPKGQRDALRDLSALNGETLEGLNAALRDAQPATDPVGVATQVSALPGISPDVVAGIVEVIFSIAYTAVRVGLPVPELVNEAARAAQADEIVDQSDEARRRLGDRMLSLISAGSAITASVKALDILLRHKNAYVSARIISDIRTVFSEGVDPDPLAALIVHNLEVIAHTDDEHVSHYFALDVADLRGLRDVIDRALQKEGILKRTIETAGLSYVDASDRREALA